MKLTPQSLRAGCKANLSLRITGVREDGYHTLDSLFWPLDEPHDTLCCEPGDEEGVTVTCRVPGIDPLRNTLTKAYAALAAATGFAPRLRVNLEKGIPHGAGLGGGSADAAALLIWLNALAPLPLDAPALADVALRVGADVPFFLRSVPCRVRGVGERITPCEASALRGLRLVLACPPIQVSTVWAYKAWDTARERNFSSQILTSPGGEAKDSFLCPRQLVNDFERPVFAAYPALRTIKEDMLRHGAAAAILSGSGASLAGLFRAKAPARRAAEALRLQGIRVYQGIL